jgi:RNA polymerase-binding transcription factor DksA
MKVMKLSSQAAEEHRSTGLKRRSQSAFAPETSMCHRLMKQRARLLRLREDLAKEIQQLRGEACEETPNYSMHMADAATDSFDRDLVLGLVSFEQEGLYEIDAALKRIENGTYGICELTGEAIPRERLEAIPWTRFSIQAENQLEGNLHPHIGRLGRVRMGETELSGVASDGLADEEVDLSVDPDLLSIRPEIGSRVPAERDDDQPMDE